MIYSLHIVPVAGAHINEVADVMARLAMQHSCKVTCAFRDRNLTANPGDGTDEILASDEA